MPLLAELFVTVTANGLDAARRSTNQLTQGLQQTNSQAGQLQRQTGAAAGQMSQLGRAGASGGAVRRLAGLRASGEWVRRAEAVERVARLMLAVAEQAEADLNALGGPPASWPSN